MDDVAVETGEAGRRPDGEPSFWADLDVADPRGACRTTSARVAELGTHDCRRCATFWWTLETERLMASPMVVMGLPAPPAATTDQRRSAAGGKGCPNLIVLAEARRAPAFTPAALLLKSYWFL
jgi:hypothetical protein